MTWEPTLRAARPTGMRATSTTGVTVALLVTLLAGGTSTDRAGTAGNPPPDTPAPTATVPTAGTSTPGSTPTAASAAAAQVTLRSSGGFAGRGDVVTVEPDGRWTAVDRAGSRRTGRLSPADLGSLTALAADPRLAVEAGQPTTATNCADVMHYRLTVGSTETGYADCPAEGPPPPATQALVKLLLRATGT
ncbi:hypothetical protein KBX53_05600 [Micromonospora sp. M51]|uniref:hypothetical protein n=1 Tax=Micromonospora sp. M51 TaxID=2824889 RepID=UPI001B36169A|nr:hypothetical protein [Micromonospora sp. M51]MBQ1010426.1 hypothetical protein [Micromonospora sp. M51]